VLVRGLEKFLDGVEKPPEKFDEDLTGRFGVGLATLAAVPSLEQLLHTRNIPPSIFTACTSPRMLLPQSSQFMRKYRSMIKLVRDLCALQVDDPQKRSLIQEFPCFKIGFDH
jgi:hypothetical protein